MKKSALVLGIVFLLLFNSNVTFAADALYRMLHADEVEEFREDQDAFIVGRLIEKQGDNFKVKVLKVLSGKVSSETILVLGDFKYGWDKEIPSVNDFCVFSLKKSGTFYKKAWGIFQATSGDFKSLKLKPSNAPTPGLLGDLAAIQWYVNTGGTEKDFSFSNSIAYVKRPNGEVVQIYPVPDNSDEAKAYSDAMNQISNSPSSSETNSFIYVALCIIALTGIGILFFVIHQRKKRI